MHRSSLRRNKHHSVALQRAWNKYGEAAFQFNILLICDPDCDLLLLQEQRYFDLHKPEYNCAPTAGSPLGLKRSAETRAKISVSKTGKKHPPEFGAAISARMLGKPKSPEQRVAMSARMLGTVVPPEVREKISASLTGVKHPPERCAAKAAYQTGKKRPPAWCANISKAKTGKHRPPCTDEARRNMSAAQTKRMADPAKREEISRLLKAHHAKRKEQQP